MASRARLIALALLLLAFAPAAARAQAPADQATEERPTGLPGGVDWTFNFDASWGTFGFANSLFQDPKEGRLDLARHGFRRGCSLGETVRQEPERPGTRKVAPNRP